MDTELESRQQQVRAYERRKMKRLFAFYIPQKVYQDQCFTSKRTLARTPPNCRREETENIPPPKPSVRQRQAPPAKDIDGTQNPVKIGEKKAEIAGSTAEHSLKQNTEQRGKKDSLVNLTTIFSKSLNLKPRLACVYISWLLPIFSGRY